MKLEVTEDFKYQHGVGYIITIRAKFIDRLKFLFTGKLIHYIPKSDLK